MPKKKEYTCRVVGVRDTQTGEFYPWEDVQKDPELKRMIQERVKHNMEQAISRCWIVELQKDKHKKKVTKWST